MCGVGAAPRLGLEKNASPSHPLPFVAILEYAIRCRQSTESWDRLPRRVEVTAWAQVPELIPRKSCQARSSLAVRRARAQGRRQAQRRIVPFFHKVKTGV